MGCLVGLVCLGIGVLYYIFNDMTIVTALGLELSSIALFGRVGWIYTKAVM